MPVTHHPDQFLLSDYAAGSVAPAVALPIAVHLEFCPQCKAEQRELAELGAGMFDTLDPVPVSEDTLAQVMQRIGGQNQGQPPRRKSGAELPAPLAGLVPEGLEALEWARQGSALKVTRLGFGDMDREVALHQIHAGGRAPEHGHSGREFTVVLRGGFSDADGDYRAGDFVMRSPGDSHRPVAWNDSDCLCLSVQEGPIRFEGLFSRILNPFIKLQPR